MQYIYDTLQLRSPEQIHHINRYIKFITSRTMTGNVRHHILPKATDMFPEYISLKENSWNLANLSYREHFIAHKILAKIFPKSSQSRAFYYMLNKSNKSNKSSREYQILLEEQREFMKAISID